MGTIDSNLAADSGLAVVQPQSTALRELVTAIAAGAAARERGEGDARDAIALVRAARLGVFRVPKHEGGAGATLPQLFELVLDLAEADSNIPHILRNHFAFVEKALRARQLPQYQRWTQRVLAGELFGLGASELGTQNIGDGDGNTRLEPAGAGYRLTGTKYYSTGNLYFDHIIVNAKTSDGRFVGARVSVRQPGVDVRDDWDGIGQRQTASGTTVFSNVEVAAEDVLVYADEVQLPQQATFAQLYLTTIIAGILRRVAKDAVELVQQRQRNFYHAVAPRPADDPLLQETVGELQSAAFVAEAAVLNAAAVLGEAFDSAIAGQPDDALFVEAALRSAKAKVVIDQLALQGATRIFDVGGASAAKQASQLDRHWRNIRTIASHNPGLYKARVLGNHALNGVPLPAAAFF
ncbi:acyl-CoA dehydrogenase [Paraburkholderia atlantica]|uniref:Acyl-CoA dehydrogenase type 2 domain protein n=1 Tax=Paraburkholderia atlantica TaxID=2654982 RepID=D5WK26_PARAM|nr:acyl-CoA dehydrogenase [Paraburkholderia atlantica]ADG19572.1 Acyl-CoA dehydrogenase type 2 domain protein [Paraburkholderia atlantica]MBB5509174.1 alkylation response protein AidB-like acyl-CoA dehydrogenase [Paraburkholderia atlantica]